MGDSKRGKEKKRTGNRRKVAKGNLEETRITPERGKG